MKDKKYDDSIEGIAFVMLLYNLLTGLFFIISGNQVIEHSLLYQQLGSLFTMDMWGLIFLSSSILLMFGIVNKTKTAYVSFLFGGLIGSCVMFLYAIARFDTTDYTLFAARYSMMAILQLGIAIYGGVMAWNHRKKQK
ncbi:hypothetical protein [Listeria cornellensis]|uniref:Uncharacterized protein n=1 Tax=Listeria cornellensis FSL F6-0969 TaxID=1265820 RepID=W7C1X2_9LIST|nr:hypothetical protein [Listeria cornellensis]EUJ29596.1 hypothetical protein PCORN_10577 [Listeria cornellensis FSL F6-0969]